MKINRKNRGDKCEYKVWNDYQSQIIGEAILDQTTKPIKLENINIKRNRRNKGIGSQLLKKIKSDYKNSEIIAWVFSGRTDWYQRHGFNLEKEKENLVKVRKPPQ